jgi:Zinc knuckle
MSYKYNMASLAEDWTTRDVRGEVAKKILKELEFVEVEMGMEQVNEEDRKLYVWKRASIELKEILKRKIEEQFSWEELSNYIKNELKEEISKLEMEYWEGIRKELETLKASEESKELRMKELERELWQWKQMAERGRTKNWQERSKISCYLCNKLGHMVKDCPDNMNKSNKNYSYVKKEHSQSEEEMTNYSLEEKRRKLKGIESEDVNRKYIAKKHRIQEVQELVAEYPEVFDIGIRKIEFCKIAKCAIITGEGKKIVKKGQIIPQALKERTKIYLGSLEKRGIIRNSISTWRNPIRAIEKPNGEVRVVSNLIALNELVEKDPYELPNIRKIVAATQGSKIFTVRRRPSIM